ncbi:MAG: M28 family peptidase [Planctomycetota bacterium]
MAAACLGVFMYVLTAAPAAPPASDPVRRIIDQVALPEFLDYLRILTGESPVPGEGWYLSNRWSHGSQIHVAARWIRGRFAMCGLKTELHNFDRNFGPNVIGELRGTRRPDDIYIFCGHYDTHGEFFEEWAPGCDDNGSGTAAVLLAARILPQYRFDATIRLIAFSGEEQWLVGSTAYARRCRQRGEHIAGVINLDMFLQPAFDDFRTSQDYDLDLGGDERARWLTEFAAAQIRRYTPITVEVSHDGRIISDHAGFWPSEYPATGMLENTDEEIWSGSNYAYHQVWDVISKPGYDYDFAIHVIRGALAALVQLAGRNPPDPGDLDGDGCVTPSDFRWLARRIYLKMDVGGLDPCDPRRNADCNGDGRVDVADIGPFLHYLLRDAQS